MPSDEQLETLAGAIKSGSLDPKTLPDDKRQRLKVALIDYQTRKSREQSGYIPGTPEGQKTESPSYVPGQFPYEEEKKIWDQSNKEGLDYYQAKQKVVEARNKYTKSRPSGDIGENIQSASGIVSGTAMAPLGMAKIGIESAGEELQKKYPDSAIASGLGKALKFGAGVIPTSPLQATGQIAADVGVPVAVEKMREPAKKIVGWFAQKAGGLSADTIKLLEDRAPEVIAYARKGYEVSRKAATDAGKAIQGHIEDYANRAGEEYRAAIDSIIKQNPQYNNLRIDLQRNMGQSLDRIRNDFGFSEQGQRLPNLELVGPQGGPIQAAQGAVQRIGKSSSDTQLFNEFSNQIKNSRTPSQVYYLQRDLSDAIRSNQGKPIASALAQLKKEVINVYDSSVGGTPLGGVNKGYRSAMSLAEDLSRIESADNPLQVVKSAMDRDTNTADSLRSFFDKSPEAKSAWEKAQVADAGSKISAWSRGINAHTGASVLPAVLAGEAVRFGGGNIPATMGAAAMGFAGTSPRLYGEGFNLLSKELPSGISRSAALAALAAKRNLNGP